MTGPVPISPRVLVIGGGPAGLTAAAALAHDVDGDVLVVEREAEAGGIPRHSDHRGYGVRDLRRFLTGPEYARRLVASAREAGAVVRTQAMVTGWSPDGAAVVTTPQGRLTVTADVVVLATGARERPRAARLVPGDRPRGILTTGQLQNLVHLHHGAPGTRAVVVGAELVSWSAVLTLREAGCRTVQMTSEHATPESYSALTAVGRTALRVPVATRTRVVAVEGRGTVEAVVLQDLDTGARRTVACDTVVFTGDWIPDNELARTTGLDLDPAGLAPVVDGALRTSRPGVFGAGNLLHPVDTADVAALDGRHVAEQVRRYLRGVRAADNPVRLLVEPPLRWVSPSLVRAADPAPARNRLLLWTDELVRSPTVTVRQGGDVIATMRLPWPASPGRVFRVPYHVLRRLDPAQGDVTLSI